MADTQRYRVAMSVYTDGCYRELQALKPGNVSVYAPGHDMNVRQFQRSAEVSAEPLCTPEFTLGQRIQRAVVATRTAVGCNTNLGILLLCGPLLQAFVDPGTAPDLRASVARVLETSTLEDARQVYQAIRLANPGGLGDSTEQDVQQEPDVSLRSAMRIADKRDRIARQYSHDYTDIFDIAMPRLQELLALSGSDELAVTGLFLHLLGRFADSHIIRKQGAATAVTISRQARDLERVFELSNDHEQTHATLLAADAEFKSRGINPGTTADLVVATLVAADLDSLFSRKQKELLSYEPHGINRLSLTTHTTDGGGIWQ